MFFIIRSGRSWNIIHIESVSTLTGCMQFTSDTNHLATALDPEVKGSVFHNTCPYFRGQLHFGSPQASCTSDLYFCSIGYKFWGFHEHIRFSNFLEWLIEPKKTLYLWFLFDYKRHTGEIWENRASVPLPVQLGYVTLNGCHCVHQPRSSMSLMSRIFIGVSLHRMIS